MRNRNATHPWVSAAMASMARWRRFVAAATVAILLTPAAAAAIEDRRWCRWHNEHFDFVTDLGRRKATELFISLDRFRVAASALLPGRPPDRAAPLKLLVFKSAGSFTGLFKFPRISGFMRPSLNQSLLAFGPDRSGRYLHAIAFHEYTHYLLRSRAALNLPIWYEEGLASYLATLEVRGDGVVTVGRGPHALLRFLVKQPEVAVDEVVGERFRLDWQRHDLADVYTLAWGIVRFLHHARRPDGSRYAENLGAMLAAIDEGAASTQAMHAELGIPPNGLQDRMRDYFDSLGSEPPPVFRFRIGDYEVPAFEHSCLNAVDRRMVLGDAVALHHPQQAETFYDYVLKRDADHVAALIGKSRVAEDAEAARRAAEAAYAAAPDDPAVNVRMAQLRIASCQSAADESCAEERSQAAAFYDHALAVDGSRADAAYGLGVLHLHAGRAQDALVHLGAAHLRAPWSPRINYYLGAAYRIAGDAGSARQHLLKTAHWHPDEAWRERASRLLDGLPAAHDNRSGP